MSMNIDIKTLKPILFKYLKWLKRYYIIIGIVVIALMYAYLIIQISLLNQREPTIEQVSEKLDKIVQPSVNEDMVNKLKQLEENSPEVQSLFQQARENPFQE